MRNIKLVVEYDGSDFSGWQYQPNAVTVQGELERSLSNLTQSKVRLTAAGRTDAGVHALGQVANFHTNSQLPAETIKRGGNAMLAKSIRIVSADEVSESFSARFSARVRKYRYVISKRPKAIGRMYSWFCPYKLNVDPMQQACTFILGENDFEAFCHAGAKLEHYRCNVLSALWFEKNDDLIFEVTANRFVHNMVRILAGTFVEIGRGKRTPEDMQAILESKDRKQAGATVPAHGLFLVSVGYFDE
ncbi:MAG: tRNA pseudouridine(38-40) synthase TruA [Actinobacteria bacterium]|nr:tRNA pseudouridine(38-40) synthase TruA [Actinomycetota bacterium]